MKHFIAHWIITTIALGVAVWVLPGLAVDSPLVLVVSSLVLGLVNATIRPILVILTLPLTLVTLGLFYLVVNGFAFALAAAIVPGFQVASLGWAILGAILVSIVSWFGGALAKQP